MLPVAVVWAGAGLILPDVMWYRIGNRRISCIIITFVVVVVVVLMRFVVCGRVGSCKCVVSGLQLSG